MPNILLITTGLPRPAEMSGGLDLLPQWRGERAVRTAAFAEFVDDPASLDLTTVITATHKLTAYRGGAYAGREAEVGELYDLEHDPGERHNLWLDPGSAPLKAELLAPLAAGLPGSQERRMAPRLSSV